MRLAWIARATARSASRSNDDGPRLPPPDLDELEAGPEDTLRATVVPAATLVPAAGLSLITTPAATVVLG